MREYTIIQTIVRKPIFTHCFVCFMRARARRSLSDCLHLIYAGTTKPCTNDDSMKANAVLGARAARRLAHSLSLSLLSPNLSIRHAIANQIEMQYKNIKLTTDGTSFVMRAALAHLANGCTRTKSSVLPDAQIQGPRCIWHGRLEGFRLCTRIPSSRLAYVSYPLPFGVEPSGYEEGHTERSAHIMGVWFLCFTCDQLSHLDMSKANGREARKSLTIHSIGFSRNSFARVWICFFFLVWFAK